MPTIVKTRTGKWKALIRRKAKHLFREFGDLARAAVTPKVVASYRNKRLG